MTRGWWLTAGDPRWAWVLPAVVAGGVVLVVVLILVLAIGEDSDELPRQRVEPPARVVRSAAPTTIGPGITLEPQGLRAVTFGQPADDVVANLTRVLGAPEEDADQPCQDDPSRHSRWVRWADLSIRLAEQGFAGYIDGAHFPPGHAAFHFATNTGLSLGDSVDRLRQSYGDRVRVRTQPPSPGRPDTSIFTIHEGPDGDLSGVIEGTGRSATVTSIFAGQLC